MDSFGIPEVVARLVFSYLAQASLGIIMYFVFRYFSKVYVRRFLRTWSKGWLSFSLHMLSTAALMVTSSENAINYKISIPLSLLSQLGSFFHIMFILAGSYQLVYSKPINRKLFRSIITVIVLLAIVTVLAYSQNPADEPYRYVIRYGSRSLISGGGFLFAALVVWMNPKFTRGIGQKLLALSFLAFSLYQFSYILVIISNTYGATASLPGSTGLVNLIMVAMMCMSMVMWLLEDEREKLNKTNKDLDSFIYSTSHDLRAPITSILGLTYIGKLELKEEKAREYMDLIEQRVKKLNSILTDILSVSKAKKLGVRLDELSFTELLKETLTDIQFNDGALSIRVEYDKDADHHIYSDASQMKIVLGNLISNAVKYHRLNQEDPYIKISFERDNDKVIIKVEDNGQGIPKESHKKIFEMFYRASTQSEGTGLGLYIVKEALSKIKGDIEVDSVYGKGTTFKITLEEA